MKTTQECVDSATDCIRKLEGEIQEILSHHMGDCDRHQVRTMKKAYRKLLRAHCDLADARDECFPDVTVQSGGT